MMDYKSRTPRKSGAVENSYYSMLIKNVMDPIKVNRESIMCHKNCSQSKECWVGGEDSTITRYCLEPQIGHVHNTSEAQMVLQVKLNCGILGNRIISFCKNGKEQIY